MTVSKIGRMMLAGVAGAALLALAACSPGGAAKTEAAENASAAAVPTPSPTPKAVKGWAEYPLADGVIRMQPAKWRTDSIDIPVKAGAELEYKLTMKKGDSVVYSIDYGPIESPSHITSEFHGHTEKRPNGIGDLMFYSKADGAPQSGQFVAPWDGIHGWYIKNSGAKDTVVKLEVAGFYEPQTDDGDH